MRIYLFLLLMVAVVASACSSSDGGDAATDPDGSTTSAAGGLSESTLPDPTVLHLQMALDGLGYDVGGVDGLLGQHTTDAIKAFQADQGLPESGSIDIDTLFALADSSDQANHQVVEALQSAFAELGYYTGTIDGLVGPKSTDAVASFQEAEGLTRTGELDGPTFERLVFVYNEEVTQKHIAALEESGHGGGAPVAPKTVPEGALPTEYLQQGDEGPEVAALQNALVALGYRPGTPDGNFGAATASAVLAFQKHEGLQRDSIVGPDVLSRLSSPQGAGPKSGASGPRVEVDLDRQILFVVDASGNVTIINVSTGSGREYQSAEAGKGIVVAHTPIGEFVVQRRIDGNREAPLGTLYRPMYFDGGWAIHGNPYVPGYPASHGCVRTANIDQDFIFDALADGEPIWIYGKNPPLPDNADAGF